MQDRALYDNSERLPAVNYYHKALHLGCCSSPRSASTICESFKQTCTTEKETTESEPGAYVSQVL